MTARLTDDTYWEVGYAAHPEPRPLDVVSFRGRADRAVVDLIVSAGLSGRRVLEVGAGDSAVLVHLAGRLPDASFTGLDYAETGCELLTRRAAIEGVVVEVLHRDLFAPTPELRARFDVIYSIGVVEHFTELPVVLRAMGALLAPGGTMVTLIPNMAGVLGSLTRRWNRAVYDLHVPHDRASFRRGHAEAGLAIVREGFLLSNNFGVLSSCFRAPTDPGWRSYLWLTRVTKAIWRLEGVLGELPHSARFSPYIYAVSRHAA